MNILNFIINPTIQFLLFLYNLLGHNLGLAIIALTLIFRGALFPLSISSIRSAKKMQDLKPHLDKLKKKHSDKAKLQQAQLELYKQHGINPAAGCLPQIVQLILLISLYQVFIRFLKADGLNGVVLNTQFLWLNLSKPDSYHILPILAGVSQLFFSLMMRSGLEHHTTKPTTTKAKEKEEDSMDMASAMQSQMLFLMPAMTTIIAFRFPSGLALYWVITTLFSALQQYIIAGPGGLSFYYSKLKKIINRS